MHSCILGCVLDYNIVSAIVWISFFAHYAIYFTRNMFMHYHALLFSFPSFLSIFSCCVFMFSLFLVSCYGTQEIHSFKEPDISLWFFLFFFYPFLRQVP